MAISIPGIEYFLAKNKYSGNIGEFNYKIIPEETLKIYIWFGKYCIDSTPSNEMKEFDLSTEGYQSAVEWISQKLSEWNN